MKKLIYDIIIGLVVVAFCTFITTVGVRYILPSVKGVLTKEVVLSLFLFFLVVLLLSGLIYNYFKRKRLENSFENLAAVNRIYRDSFSRCNQEEDLVKIEQSTLRDVCSQIAKFFERVINYKCMVTIKLLEKKGNEYYATTYVRSDNTQPIDNEAPIMFRVGDKKNSCFDKIFKSDEREKCFFSPDLTKMSNYTNEREKWKDYYLSILSVPIQSFDNAKPAKGYLYISTRVKNKLNDTFHLKILLGFANQIFNFFSFTRGDYVFNRLQK